MKRKKQHNQNILSRDGFLDEAFNRRLMEINSLNTNDHKSVTSFNHSHGHYMYKEPLMKCNEVPHSGNCSHLNNSTNLKQTEANMSNYPSHDMHTLPINVDIDLMTKKNYRRESIIRWKNKRYKMRMSNTNNETSTVFAATYSFEPAESSNRTFPVLIQRIGKDNSGKSTQRRRSKNSRRQGRIPDTGRDLLQFVPDIAETLPWIKDCSYCGAAKFYSKTTNFCCLTGRVVLTDNELPDILKQLLTSTSEEAKAFRTCIRTYNNLFAFTSFGVKSDANLSKRNNGIYTFRVQGQVYHFINDLHPENNNAKNLQLYFHDTEHELQNRLASCDRLCEQTTEACMKALQQNPYARFFRSLKDVPQLENYKIILKTIPSQDQRVYNKPEVSQVAALWVDEDENGEHNHRNIEVKTHSNQYRKIEYYYGCYDSLQYPLMFPFGELGWHQGILNRGEKQKKGRGKLKTSAATLIAPQNAANVEDLLCMEQDGKEDIAHLYTLYYKNQLTSNDDCCLAVLEQKDVESKFVSVREYYAYKLQIRKNDKSYLLRFGRLLQQYIVDNYVKLETQRLDYFRSQQQEIRREILQGVVDAVAAGETEGSSVGQRIVLPSSFIGGPRNMRRKYIDAMTLVQKYGKPDIFLTMTSNPNWPEVKEHLMRQEESQNRADLVVRVFHAKLEQLKIDLFKRNIFGEVAAYTYVIEFQKRGLPHVHILIILKPKFKMYSPEEYDQIVSAEIPNEKDNPHLYKMVVKHMLHGPCGILNPKNVCMKKSGKCKNSYPRPYSDETTQTTDAYPIYRRRNDGVKVNVRRADLDNRWVIPYNAYLLAKFDCHINVEICSKIKAVKYIYKYIYKGCDKISFGVLPNNEPALIDEILQYQSGRWVSPPEAAWRIFRFPMSEIKPAVIHLQLHLENHQPLTFKKKDKLNNVLQNPVQRKTMLTEFFFMNRTDEFAQRLNLTYSQFLDYFVWQQDKKYWKYRQTGDSIGRIVSAHPSEGERYYLRILLSKVRCPRSFSDLKTCNGVQVGTFREAASLRGYLVDDNSQQLCLQEASVFHMPYELRRLFATILVYMCPNSPRDLWLAHENLLLEDFLRSNQMTHREAKKNAFQQINGLLQSMGKSIHDFDLVPQDFSYADVQDQTREIRAEKSIIVSEEDLNAISNLNEKQKIAFDTIIEKVYSGKSGAFFVDGPGGTGKTYLYRALLAKVRSGGDVALATATSGIAASILPGGRTAHSRFKIPLDLQEGSICRVSKQSSLATLIKDSKLIIWDEAPMAKRTAIEALNDLLQDLMGSTEPFGGKVVVFGGDFRQTLPVVRKGTKSETMAACLTNSSLWPSLYKLHLEENMRAKLDPVFTGFLLKIGNGTHTSESKDSVNIPLSMLIETGSNNDSLNALIDYVYPNIQLELLIAPCSLNRAILTTKNNFVGEINDILIERFPGEEVEYVSSDETSDPNDQVQYEDFLHSITPNGMPPHRLVLKPNAPIILLRNLNPTEGLCNGTRLICKDLKRNVIHAEIAFGDFAGRRVFIHRIPLQPPSDEQFTVPFKRVQFPIRLCFAMTINKAQGQTLDIVGIYLKEPVFSHGQLYVALSRARTSKHAKVLIRDSGFDASVGETKNIVYREVLQSCHYIES